MRQRFVSSVVCAVALALLAPGAALGADPSGPKDNGVRRWAVRPAGRDGKPDARTHFTLQASPGGSVSDTALISNLSPVAVTFRVYGTDAFNTPTGAFDLLAAQKTPTDVGSWMKFASSSVTVPAGRSAAVPFTIAVPANATPGDHAGGVVVAMLLPGKQVTVESRVANRVYLRIPGDLRPMLTVTPVRARYSGVTNPFGHGKVAITYTVANTGNIRLRSHPKLTVSNAAGSTLATLTPADLPELLPNSNVTFTAALDHVFPAGPLTVKVELTAYSDPEQPVGQKIQSMTGKGYVWAVSWLLVLLVVAVLAVLAALWWWRRRQLVSRLRGVSIPDRGGLPVGAGTSGGRA